jgi:hypothetical protein
VEQFYWDGSLRGRKTEIGIEVLISISIEFIRTYSDLGILAHRLKIGSAIVATVRVRARPLGQRKHRRNHLPVGLGPLITLLVGVPASASASVCASQVDKDQIHKGFNHTLLCIFMYTFLKSSIH